MNSREVSLTGIPCIGRATVVGALLGAVSVAVPVGIALAVSGGGPMSILFAVHVGLFGGMGYGGMLGAVIQADRFERGAGAWHTVAMSSPITAPDKPGLRANGSHPIDHAAA